MTSASVTMIRALNKLKTVLKHDGITTIVEAPGTSNILLRVVGSSITVTCRTNPRVDHRWWFWLEGEPIASANDPVDAAEAIKRIRASTVTR